MVDLRGRHFLKELDFTPDEWSYLLDLAGELKADRAIGKQSPRLVGKSIVLIFEKTSTRTRCAFEVAAYEQGAHTTYLDSTSSQLGHKESIADTARVLGRMFHGIEYRGFAQESLEQLAASAGVPVFNGLTDEWHPTQMLADQLTMLEHGNGRPLSELTLAYVGDARSNEGNSVLVSSALMGMDVRLVSPSSLRPSADVVREAERLAEQTGAKITLSDNLDAVEGADFIYTDVWVSMGEPKEIWESRIDQLRPYQVNTALLRRTGNPHVQVLHCLPAFHDLETSMAQTLHQVTGLREFEITNEVFEQHANIIFDEAENRMHTIKAVLVATLAE